MPSVGSSASRNANSGGRQPGSSRKGGNPMSAGQADARTARLASLSSGAVSEAVRAHAQEVLPLVPLQSLQNKEE